jgi:regulatory protein
MANAPSRPARRSGRRPDPRDAASASGDGPAQSTARPPSGATAAKSLDPGTLRDAALTHLARYATTAAGLRRVLHRRIDRWARSAEAIMDRETIEATIAEARVAVDTIVTRLVETRVINDAEFAASRARSLVRAGKSRLAVAAHLASKGIATDLARDAVPKDGEAELTAALVLARRRRIGPFRPLPGDSEADPMRDRRELGILARAGFPQAVATTALAMDPDEAEDRILALRR